MKRKRIYDADELEHKRIKLECQLDLPHDCLLKVFEFCQTQQLLFIVPLVCRDWNCALTEYSDYLTKLVCFYEWPCLKTMNIRRDWRSLLKKYGQQSIMYKSFHRFDQFQKMRSDLEEDPFYNDPFEFMNHLQYLNETISQITEWAQEKKDYETKQNQYMIQYDELVQMKQAAEIDIQLDDNSESDDEDDTPRESIDGQLEHLFMKWIMVDTTKDNAYRSIEKQLLSSSGKDITVEYQRNGNPPKTVFVSVQDGNERSEVILNTFSYEFIDCLRTLYEYLDIKSMSYWNFWDCLTHFEKREQSKIIHDVRSSGFEVLKAYFDQNLSPDPSVNPKSFRIEYVDVNSAINYAYGKQYLSANPNALEKAPDKYFQDLVFIVEFVVTHPSQYKRLPSDLQQNSAVIAKLAELAPNILFEYGKPRHYKDKKRVLNILSEAIKQNPELISLAPEYFKNDAEIVLIAVTHNGLLLEHASLTLRRNIPIVMAALNENMDAIEFVPSKTIQVSKEVKALISQVTLSEAKLRRLIIRVPELTSDMSLMKPIISKYGSLVSVIPGPLISVDLICTVLKQNISNLLELDPVPRSVFEQNASLIKAAILESKECSALAELISPLLPKSFTSDAQLMKKLIQLNQKELEGAPQTLKSDPAFIVDLVKHNPESGFWIYKQAHPSLQVQDNFIIECFNNSSDSSLWKNLSNASVNVQAAMLVAGANYDIVPPNRRLMFADNLHFVKSIVKHGTDTEILDIFPASSRLKNDRELIVALLKRRAKGKNFMSKGRFTPFKKFCLAKMSEADPNLSPSAQNQLFHSEWQKMKPSERQIYGTDVYPTGPNLWNFPWSRWIPQHMQNDPEISKLLRD